jgi:ABC-type nickel/cobalt efflux system permease component RcnA
VPSGPATLPALIWLGFAGGLVPSPSALVVLLAGFAEHRAWFGLILVIGYGIGMALALTAIGLVLVRARHLLERLTGRGGTGRLAAAAGLIPVAAAVAILAAGGYLAVSSLQTV